MDKKKTDIGQDFRLGADILNEDLVFSIPFGTVFLHSV